MQCASLAEIDVEMV